MNFLLRRAKWGISRLLIRAAGAGKEGVRGCLRWAVLNELELRLPRRALRRESHETSWRRDGQFCEEERVFLREPVFSWQDAEGVGGPAWVDRGLSCRYFAGVSSLFGHRGELNRNHADRLFLWSFGSECFEERFPTSEVRISVRITVQAKISLREESERPEAVVGVG